MSGEQAGAIGLGLFACLVAAGGIVATVRRHRHRAAIASTYGATGGVAYTIVQAGCSGILLLGGLGLVVVALLVHR